MRPPFRRAGTVSAAAREPPAMLCSVSTTVPQQSARPTRPAKYQGQRQGIQLLAGIVVLMWVIEVVNTIDSNRLDHDGIWARNVPHLWGILTAPFLHASFQHLIANTIPFVLLGLVIALHGAARLALVSAVIILVG